MIPPPDFSGAFRAPSPTLMKNDTYAHCPRLPEEGPIDPRTQFEESAEASSIPPETPVELEIGPGRGWFTV